MNAPILVCNFSLRLFIFVNVCCRRTTKAQPQPRRTRLRPGKPKRNQMQNNHTQNCQGSGCWLQRIVRCHGRIIQNICSSMGCSATIQLTTKLPATPGESLPASGIGVGASNIQKIATIGFRYGRCETCPRFHALWQRAIEWSDKGEQILTIPHLEPNLSNRHWNITKIGNGESIAAHADDAICANEKSRLNTNANLVAVMSADGQNQPGRVE